MSAAYCGCPALPPSVYPSGALNAAERLNIGWSYAGNALATVLARFRMMMGLGQ